MVEITNAVLAAFAVVFIILGVSELMLQRTLTRSHHGPRRLAAHAGVLMVLGLALLGIAYLPVLAGTGLLGLGLRLLSVGIFLASCIALAMKQAGESDGEGKHNGTAA